MFTIYAHKPQRQDIAALCLFHEMKMEEWDDTKRIYIILFIPAIHYNVHLVERKKNMIGFTFRSITSVVFKTTYNNASYFEKFL